jgi:hypothetical protein
MEGRPLLCITFALIFEELDEVIEDSFGGAAPRGGVFHGEMRLWRTMNLYT